MKQQLYTGVVEDRTTDPLKLGRCKVRVFGLHSDSKKELPTEELPWAVVMQPITSAATSGIGYSPVGPVEGSWVVVMFNDEYNQQPIIIGTLGGVPFEQKVVSYVEQANVWKSADGTVVTAADGTPVQSASTTVLQKEDTSDQQKVFKPSSLSLSAAGFAFIKSVEGLASLEKGRTRIGNDKTPGDTVLYSYLDTENIWTIGWGSTTLANGSKVNQNTTITKAEADALFEKKLAEEFEPAVKRKLKVPVTQSMYDALVSLVYNGWVGIFSNPAGTALNAGKYKEAASLIPDYKTRNGTLKSRREKEKALFMKDGFPTQEGDIEPSPVTEEKKEAQTDATQNPAVIKPAPGTSTSATAEQTLNTVSADGFVDPNKVYPKWKNEPDTHRLARHENINKTIVYGKEAARVKDVPTASGSSWTQPPIPYNAKYPFNHVFSSESGHVQEFDDTQGNERIHWYHKAGTYTEVDVNGTRVNRIVGDSYEIQERNGNVLIKGTCNVTIEGNSNVRIQNDSNIQVLGNANLNVTGNLKQAVGGNYQIHVGGEFHVDASMIYWNSQKATGVALPTEGATGVPSFGRLTTPSRSSEIDANYETPEEGDPEDFVNEGVKTGTIEQQETPTEPVEEKDVPEKIAAPISTECGSDIANGSPFNRSFRLSDNFTLGKVCVGRSGVPSGVNYGLSDKEIVCNLRLLAVNCLEPIVKKYPNMIITNTWRSEQDNIAVGGSKTSDHLTGCAADIQFTGFDRNKYYEVAQDIQQLVPAYKQLILEYKGDTTWIHISFKKTNNSMQVLTMDASKNKVIKSGGFVLV
jgi:GH24 family phage-related lysozyme (muramidase)